MLAYIQRSNGIWIILRVHMTKAENLREQIRQLVGEYYAEAFPPREFVAGLLIGVVSGKDFCCVHGLNPCVVVSSFLVLSRPHALPVVVQCSGIFLPRRCLFV